ncbi:MAG TPA: dihydrofolate reductase [bacterium]|nr:dihydrofolate reductase [bacterium]
MIVSLIVAMDENRGIGANNKIPWRLSTDLKRFKALTMGHHLILGRKTFESIGKPLPGRTMIIVTRNVNYIQEGCLVAHTLNDALDMTRERGESEVFVMGGGEIFSWAIDVADRLYLTMVHTEVEADVFFPVIDKNVWIETEESYHEADKANEFPCTFKCLIRITPATYTSATSLNV